VYLDGGKIMLRIIDMREAMSLEKDDEYHFAVWSTVNGQFLSSDNVLLDTQVWTREEWIEDFANEPGLRDRVLRLLPEEK
jgi:hypothetical protein